MVLAIGQIRRKLGKSIAISSKNLSTGNFWGIFYNMWYGLLVKYKHWVLNEIHHLVNILICHFVPIIQVNMQVWYSSDRSFVLLKLYIFWRSQYFHTVARLFSWRQRLNTVDHFYRQSIFCWLLLFASRQQYLLMYCEVNLWLLQPFCRIHIMLPMI